MQGMGGAGGGGVELKALLPLVSIGCHQGFNNWTVVSCERVPY